MISDWLADLDERIFQTLERFKEIKSRVPPKRYEILFAPHEKALRCQTSIGECTCRTKCPTMQIHETLDYCNEIIEMYDANPERYIVSYDDDSSDNGFWE